MKLAPSLKPKKRYILFKIIPTPKDHKFWKREVIDAIEQQLIKCFGIFMHAKASPMIVKETFDEKTQQIIIKIGHKFTDELIFSMGLIKEIKDTPVHVEAISTSGILKKLKAKMSQ
jgi:RNase P/RNase MRP subunit POP5